MDMYAVVKVWQENGQTKVAVPFCADSVSAVQEERDRLLVDRAPGTVIATVKVENCKLSMAGMGDVADSYAYECLRTSILYRLRESYPGLDETNIEVQKLIDMLANHADEDVIKGADEDWSIDKAFRTLGEAIAKVCAEED